MSPRAIIVSADELKKTIPGYDPSKSDLVHEASSTMADRQYEEVLRSSIYKEVILMSGGGASGKTEFVSAYLKNKPVIILDGTLKNYQKAMDKIRLAHKYRKKVTIMAIWPADFKVAFAAFLQRERKYPDKHFYHTHCASRRTLLEIAESELDVEILIYENVYDKQGLIFYERTIKSRSHLIDDIKANQYTEDQVLKIVTNYE